MIYFAIIVNLLLIFKLIWDYQAKNKNHRIINHGRSALIDGFIYVLSAWLLLGWTYIIPLTLIACGYRWVMFDLLFNLFNKDKWNHYGESSMLDRFLSKTGHFHVVIKLIPIIIGTLILIL